jgi:hypothetical protein
MNTLRTYRQPCFNRYWGDQKMTRAEKRRKDHHQILAALKMSLDDAEKGALPSAETKAAVKAATVLSKANVSADRRLVRLNKLAEKLEMRNRLAGKGSGDPAKDFLAIREKLLAEEP